MRRIADLRKEIDQGGKRICRLMLHDSQECTLVFLYSIPNDGPCDYDEWYTTVAEAEAASRQRYGVKPEDWRSIPDVPPDCWQDWIAPVRNRGVDVGRPEWDLFERLESDGSWSPITPGAP